MTFPWDKLTGHSDLRLHGHTANGMEHVYRTIIAAVGQIRTFSLLFRWATILTPMIWGQFPEYDSRPHGSST